MKKLELMKRNEYAMNEVYVKNYNYIAKSINEFLVTYDKDRLEQLDIWAVGGGIESDIDEMTSHDIDKLDYFVTEMIEFIETENFDY